jgi:leader peptidase (prepilin peptidase)/N-methyltransferase
MFSSWQVLLPCALIRYLTEAVTGGLFSFVAWRWGWTMTALVWCADFRPHCWQLAVIDWDTTLLPAVSLLPLLWAGLIATLTVESGR